MPISRRSALAILLGLMCCTPLLARETPVFKAPGVSYYAIGDLDAPRPGKTSAALMLMGGGDWEPASFRWFFERAGNGHIVVLRASGADENQKEMHEDIGGTASVQTLVFDARAPASDPAVLDIVAKADGIWLAGGDQARYIRFWKGTPLNDALDKHVRDGKPIGGTSAGLAVLGEHAYGALDDGSITSPEALADPLGAAVTLDSGFLHMPHMRGIVTDTHFEERERQGRLLAFIAKLQHDTGRRDIVGLGIDENTVLAVEADGSARLFTGNGGYAWLFEPTGAAETKAGVPLTFRNVAVTGIGADSRFDLATRKVTNPAFRAVFDVQNGVPTRRDAE